MCAGGVVLIDVGALIDVSAATSCSDVSKNACAPSTEIAPKAASASDVVAAGPVEIRVTAPPETS